MMLEKFPTRLDLMRAPQNVFPAIANPLTIRSARIWHCGYRSLAPLGECLNLEELVIANLPDTPLDFLRPLRKLKYLSILHMPKITDLEPLGDLVNLEVLSLATSPAWDSRRKCTVVKSLIPLTRLPVLKHLELFGVVPADKSLTELIALPALVSARVSQFPGSEVQRLREQGISDEFAPASSFSISDGER